MNELRVFENSEFGKLDIMLIDGKEYFPATDCARILGYTNPRDAIARHCKGCVKHDGVSLTTNQHGTTTEQTVEKSYIPEGDLYRLIIRSKLPAAERFEKWVFDEVLPAIRKTGGYIAGEADMTDEELLSKALLVMQSKLTQREQRLQQLEADNSRLTVQNTIMAPKADYFDELVDRNLLTSFRETAKQLQVKERAFVDFLLKHKYVYRDRKGKLMPYAEKNGGLFEVKECVNEKTAWSGTQTLITPKGRETFRLLMQGMKEVS